MRPVLAIIGRLRIDAGGATATEFALILPIFAMLTFGFVELSNMFFESSSVQWALDRAGRMAVTDPNATASDIETTFRNELVAAGSPHATFDYTSKTLDGVPVIDLTAHYQHVVEAPFIPQFTVTFNYEKVVPKTTI